MYILVQRVGDRVTGGEMTGLESITNGPVSCPPNAFWQVGWIGRHRYWARISDCDPVSELR